MFDLKAHVLHGKSFTVLRGPVLIPIGLAIVTLTVASYFLNAVFAFAISQPGRSRSGQPLRGLSALGADHGPWGHHRCAARVLNHRRDPLGATMVHSFARDHRRRDDGQLRGCARAADRGREAQAVNPRQVLNQRGRRRFERNRLHTALHPRKTGNPDARIQSLVIPGIFVFALGVTLQAGATGAVRAIKMSATLTTAGRTGGSSGALEKRSMA